MTKLYTKKGDDGKSSVRPDYNGIEQRAKKCDCNFELTGSIDELNAHIGMARSLLFESLKSKSNVTTLSLETIAKMILDLEKVQNDLLDVGSFLFSQTIFTMPTQWYEDAIDGYTTATPEISNFVLPGGTLVNAELHICRTLARKFERNLAAEMDNDGRWRVIQYMAFANRLSDFFFAMARYELHLFKPSRELLWDKRDLRTGFTKEESKWISIPTNDM